jgi:cation:H+ antiporter
MNIQWPTWLIDASRYLIAGWNHLTYLDPYFSLALFMGASFVMIWRLGVMERKGLEGTVLGTLVMPYASGLSNLIFAYIMGRNGQNGRLVLENCIVNNATNLTLLIGLPAMIWGLDIFPEKRLDSFRSGPHKAHRLNHLSLLLTLLAVIFFTGTLWALARDNQLDFSDGLVLVGLFVFWQILHVFDVLKHNIQRGRTLYWSMLVDFLLVMLGALSVFGAIERLVTWITENGTGWLVFDNLGWLSGILMVLPNALLAVYYARAKRADIVYSSQIGDGHICIPMCIGLFALFAQIEIPAYFNIGILTILGACMVHLIFISIWARLPKWMGIVCVLGYVYFFYTGLIH